MEKPLNISDHVTPSTAVQDYLKTIHALGGVDERVSPNDIALKLNVTAPSVSGMLRRLADGGWIEYQPGKGAQLSEKGKNEARRVIRRHRLVELFLTRVLGLDLSEVDQEAEALEHAISPRLEEALANYLGEPDEDCHGHPIPSVNGELVTRSLKPLTSFRPGQTVLIREVRDDNPARLKRWMELGLIPGTQVQFVKREDVLDLYEIEAKGRVMHLPGLALSGLMGEPSNMVGND